MYYLHLLSMTDCDERVIPMPYLPLERGLGIAWELPGT